MNSGARSFGSHYLLPFLSTIRGRLLCRSIDIYKHTYMQTDRQSQTTTFTSRQSILVSSLARKRKEIRRSWKRRCCWLNAVPEQTRCRILIYLTHESHRKYVAMERDTDAVAKTVAIPIYVAYWYTPERRWRIFRKLSIRRHHLTSLPLVSLAPQINRPPKFTNKITTCLVISCLHGSNRRHVSRWHYQTNQMKPTIS